MSAPPDRSATPLGLWDVVSIIVGIVVGTGIYETPPLILQQVSGPGVALLVWAVCGLLALVGALCYAELAAAHPRSGGDYVYLGRAYGPWVGFLFGWAQLAVILTGSIGMMAYVFADYAGRLWDLDALGKTAAAVAAVGGLSVLNLLGVVFGKVAQNLLTTAKVAGLGGILAAGFLWPSASAEGPPAAVIGGHGSLGIALVLVFLTYGGWNDAAFVAAEMRDAPRNIPRALLVGTGAVTLLYVLVNAAYLRGLGFAAARDSHAIAAEVLQRPLGPLGERAMCVLVMVSALGAVNGLIFTGARVYSTLGADHALFSWLGHWSHRRRAPVGALVAQAVVCLGMIVAIGTPAGQEMANKLVTWLGAEPLDWEGHGGFETLLKCTAPVFWLFFLLTGVSVFVLRERDGAASRPFRVPLYPYLPLVFCATCAYMLHSAVAYAGKFGLVGAGLLLLGLPLYEVSRRLDRPPGTAVPGGGLMPVPTTLTDASGGEGTFPRPSPIKR
jgi:amino acid transporter